MTDRDDRLVQAVEATNIEIVRLTEQVSTLKDQNAQVVTHVDDLRSEIRNVAPLELRVEHTEKAVDSLKDNVKWIVRLVVGLVVAGAVAAIGFKAGG